jgi:four helix bundle protein
VGGSRFRELTIYRRARGLADEIHAMVSGWESFELWTVGVQMVRSADSIGANIAEAHGRGTYADQRRILLIARGSLLEVEHWLWTTQERELADTSKQRDATQEIARMLNAMIARC